VEGELRVVRWPEEAGGEPKLVRETWELGERAKAAGTGSALLVGGL